VLALALALALALTLALALALALARTLARTLALMLALADPYLSSLVLGFGSDRTGVRPNPKPRSR